MIRFVAPLSLLCVAFLSACSEQPKEEAAADSASPAPAAPAAVVPAQSPTQVVEAFMNAQAVQDETVFTSLLTTKARETLESMGEGGFADEPLDSFTIGAETVTGDQASVDVAGVQDGELQDAAVKLRMEDGAWRIWGLAMKLSPGNEFTMDLEKMGEALGGLVEGLAEGLTEGLAEGIQQGMNNFQQGGSDEEIAAAAAAFDALAPVSAEEYEAAWKTNEDYRGQSRADALAALATPLQLAIYPGEFAGVLAEKVTTDTRGLGRMEAIDRIAREADLRTVFPDPTDYSVMQAFVESIGEAIVGLVDGENAAITAQGTEAQKLVDEAKAEIEEAQSVPKNAIRFETGDESHVWFAGPFRVEVASLEENPPHATGSLALLATAHGLPPAVLATSTEDSGMTVETVEDAQGRPLVDTNVMYSSSGRPVGPVFVDATSRDLRNLLRDVEAVHKVPVKISIARPLEVIEFDFESMEPDASQEKNGYRATVKETGTDSHFEIVRTDGAEEAVAVRTQPYKADRSPLGIVFEFANSWEETTTVQLNTAEPPARVRLKLIPKIEQHEYALDLGPIPLQHFAEMPEKLEELSFRGHASPIAVELVRIVDKEGDFRKIDIRVTNHSNKAPNNAMIDFIYRGANGEEIDSFPHTVNGNFDSDGWQPIAAPGATVELEQTAFQMPAEATTIDFVVQRIEFVDGTVWEAAN